MFRDKVSFSPAAECLWAKGADSNPVSRELIFRIKIVLILCGKGVVSVKDTGCGRQICSLWGGFCGFDIKLQKWPTKSRTGGFLHILDEVMEP